MNKELKLLRGQICFIDEIDFERYSQYSWSISGIDGYVRGMIGKQNAYLHLEIARSIWTPEQMHNMVVDHKDRNRLNNQRENLRLATYSQSQMNRELHCRNTSGYRGVTWNKNAKKWAASLQVEGKRLHLGLFWTKEQAAIAYNNAALLHFGEFAQLNQVT